jgi:organic hydroperoxide reductase OsmC/OhrA
VAEARPKVFEYSVEVDRDGIAALPGGSSLGQGDDWTPDHLLLAALVECSLGSLAYHAHRAGHEVRSAGFAAGRVTRRESDGRYAFVEIDCRIDAELTPPAADPATLAAEAERDCFVGATLTLTPRYEWRIG